MACPGAVASQAGGAGSILGTRSMKKAQVSDVTRLFPVPVCADGHNERDARGAY
ncbi:hypothetical protein SUDANB176_03919 [Streptomyces sp. enrichment culture]